MTIRKFYLCSVPSSAKMKKHYLIALLLITLIPSISEAQRIRARWKAYRFEWSGGIGASNFLGELGGANQVGTHGFRDFEFKAIRPNVCVGLRYKLTPFFALHSHITVGAISGDDKLTEEYFRKNRNLNFRSMIYEINCNFEASLLAQKEGGLYKLRGIRKSSTFEVSAYLFAGVGLFHFNPKGELNNKWIALQPLGTEGQGIDPARSKYSLTQFCIPVGFGFRYFFNRHFGVGLEYGIRKTFTDYIDDVSKTYYDPASLATINGPDAAALSDKSTDPEGSPPRTGQQRGDPSYKDAYMFGIFSIHYKLKTGRSSYPIF